MPIPFKIIKPALHALDPETAHQVTIKSLKAGLGPKMPRITDASLMQILWGLEFDTPLGLAAGFDKNAEVIAPIHNMGFGFTEVGTVTPKPQEGNPRPRVFRNVKNEAVINRMGFPNKGADVFEQNIKHYMQAHKTPTGLIGINIGMNKEQTEPEKDYCALIERFHAYADYFTINISSPNTPGLRNLQTREHLTSLIQAVKQTIAAVSNTPPPILVKLAPDLTQEQQEELSDTAINAKIDGLILTNTTLERPDHLPAKFKNEMGGLSGRPLTHKSTEVIKNFYKLTNGQIPIIGIGGISSGQDAYDKICAGASLVQLYSALVFHGPDLVTDILNDLSAYLKRDGYKNISEAVGSAA